MQLRPKVANYELSAENSNPLNPKLDVSLFERLCSDGVPSSSRNRFSIPVAKLNVQRRMRPEIADLVRFPLYNELLDHESVQNYPRVAGMYDNLYWFDHQRHEDGEDGLDMKETSHSNTFEVQMVTQLLLHLSKQDGYKSDDIVVLTPYLGQLRKLRDTLGRTFVVQLSEKDSEEVALLEDRMNGPTDEGQVAEIRQSLSKDLRIATVILRCSST
jgi:superfamily I DNA and/or RNA helicase